MKIPVERRVRTQRQMVDAQTSMPDDDDDDVITGRTNEQERDDDSQKKKGTSSMPIRHVPTQKRVTENKNIMFA